MQVKSEFQQVTWGSGGQRDAPHHGNRDKATQCSGDKRDALCQGNHFTGHDVPGATGKKKKKKKKWTGYVAGHDVLGGQWKEQKNGPDMWLDTGNGLDTDPPEDALD